MRESILVYLLFAMVTTTQAQSWVGMGMGANHSRVYFNNSAGEQDKTIKGVPASCASIHYQHEFDKARSRRGKYDVPKHLVGVEIGYKRAAARDSDSHTLRKWAMDYMTSKIGYKHVLVRGNKVVPYFGVGFTFDWLMSGVQQISFEQYDLTEELNTINYGISPEGGLMYSINHDVLGMLSVTYMQGLANLEQNEQKSKLSGLTIGIGVSFKLGE